MAVEHQKTTHEHHEECRKLTQERKDKKVTTERERERYRRDHGG